MAPTPAVGPAAARESGTGRTFVPLATHDQWLRCSHTGTVLDATAEVVMLAPQEATVPMQWGPGAAMPEPAGLTFDPRGCLYHGDPGRSQIQRVAWQQTDLFAAGSDPAAAVDLLAAPAGASGQGTTAGGFHPAAPVPGEAVRAVALAADPDDHLFILDGSTGHIHVVDLADGRLVRIIELPLPAVDLAADGRTVLVATADRTRPLVEISALGLPTPLVLPRELRHQLDALPPQFEPVRVAVGPLGERWLLLRERLRPGPGGLGEASRAIAVDDPRRSAPLEVPGATDLELDGESRLVFAGPPDGLFRRFSLAKDADTEDTPLRARRYDGRGIVRTPDGSIGFWMKDVPAGVSGFRLAVAARRRLAPAGRVDCFQLDGGAYQQVWGRCFVEACIPDGAAVRVAFVTADDEPGPLEPEGPSIPRIVPANISRDADGLPPAVPPLVAEGRAGGLARTWGLHRRATGSELPWLTRGGNDIFEVYEVPVQAPPGRFLWLRLELTGTTAVSPRIRAVRVEVPGHDLLDRLPRTYRRDQDSASFLGRYLALADGLFTDMEARAARRDLMLDPGGAPAELLPWLASLVGLILDERWPERARRTMLAEVAALFRLRGTPAGLKRMLEIYLEAPVILIEAYRFRGVGAVAGGNPADQGAPGTANAVVGFGYRVGGEVGQAERRPLAGAVSDAYAAQAHRFTVLVTRDLDDEQLATVQALLDQHRPAHTLVEVCTVGHGMRVGIGLHVEVSTLVGPSAGFYRAVVGDVVLGGGAVVGKARAGVRSDGSRVGIDSVVDP
jgi:phage tail-like protein